eukprot:gene20012-23983_t
MVEEFIYYIGGYGNGLTDAQTRRTLQLNINNLSFKTLQDSGDVPPVLILPCSATIGHYIYVYGGRNPETKITYPDLYRLDTNVMCWTRMPRGTNSHPPSRSSASMYAISSRFLLLFGGDRGVSQSLDDLWLYDLQLESWVQVHQNSASCPSARSTNGFMPYITKFGVLYLVLCGGESISGISYTDIWALNTWTLKWTCIPVAVPSSLPKLFQFANVIQEGSMILFGGSGTVQNGTQFQYPISHDIYRFPIDKVLEDLPVDVAAVSWTCLQCKCYTARKCSMCLEASFCSDSCESSGFKNHESKCPGLQQNLSSTADMDSKVAALELTIKHLKSEQSECEESLIERNSVLSELKGANFVLCTFGLVKT